MINISSIKQNAKEAFKENYWMCVLAGFISSVMMGIGNSSINGRNIDQISETMEDDTAKAIFLVTMLMLIFVMSAFALVFNTFVANVMTIGICNFFTKNQKDGNARIDEIISGFRNKKYLRNVGAMFLMKLFIGLWSLLFIIPGIIKAYEYSMVPYILNDNPDYTWKDALDESKLIMMGHKMDLFRLYLSFIGWALLAVFSCGIAGLFWVNPYQQSAVAEFYLTIKQESSDYIANNFENNSGVNLMK